MTGTRGTKGRGFTLIELLVVMALMAFITTIVMSGAFGMSRASYYSAAQDLIYNVMQMAHQRACIDGQDVYVVFKDERTLAVIQGSGRIGSDLEANAFVDNGSKLKKQNDMEVDIFNLTSWGSATMTEISEETKQDSIPDVQANYDGEGKPASRTVDDGAREYSHVVRQIHLSSVQGDWKKGDRYGFPILQDQTLPKGYQFGFGSLGKDPDKDAVCFYADGSTGVGRFGDEVKKNNDKVDIYVYEKISKSADKAIKVTVDKGSVSVSSVRNSLN